MYSPIQATRSADPSTPDQYNDAGVSGSQEASQDDFVSANDAADGDEARAEEEEDDDEDEEEDASQEQLDVGGGDPDDSQQPPIDDDDDDDDEEQERRQTRPGRGAVYRDYRHIRIRATPTLPLLTDPEIASTVREIGKSASWSLSTAKPGNGVDQLRDSSLDTYWQSDGLQPHYINIQFPKRQTVTAISLYMDFNLDESYTPKKIKVRVGTTFHNLEEVRVVDVREPVGWCTIPLWRKWGEDVLDSILDPDGGDDDDEGDEDEVDSGSSRRKKKRKKTVPLWKRKPLRTHFVQIGIPYMHQNGRDTHVRQVKIFGPRDESIGNKGGLSVSATSGEKSGNGAAMMIGSGKLTIPTFQTVEMSQFSFIR
mmetsp:Transcript_9495/g.20158  ORF Transcript_9495/g.20158 Transcript_9495/m.20158 type:complete len:368 (-) Transcript_9495:230-1333(-)